MMLNESMSILQSRDQLKAFDANSYPHSNESRRKEAHKKISKSAFPARFQAKNAVSLEDAFKALFK